MIWSILGFRLSFVLLFLGGVLLPLIVIFRITTVIFRITTHTFPRFGSVRPALLYMLTNVVRQEDPRPSARQQQPALSTLCTPQTSTTAVHSR